MNPLKFLTSAGGDLLDGVRGIIDEVDTNKKEEMTARNELAKIERQFYEKMASAREEIVKQQAKTVRAEIHSEHWLAANIRPLTLLTFLLVALYAGIFAPIFGLPAPMLNEIPERAWTVIMVGLGGYIGGRTAEKVIPNSKWGPKNENDGVDEIADKVLQRIGDANSG